MRKRIAIAVLALMNAGLAAPLFADEGGFKDDQCLVIGEDGKPKTVYCCPTCSVGCSCSAPPPADEG